MNVACESMRLAHVEHLADRHMRRLSGGERQRAAIARALCQEPELFLLDEPTAALDYKHQVQIMDMLSRLCREGKATVILASHDVNLAAMYADTLLLMRGGKVVALGAPKEVLTLENVSTVYGCPMLLDENPRTRTPRVSPLPTDALSRVQE
jgi:iron complex transport system ATP-binding protein